MKKNIILIILLIFISGCTAEYKLEVIDDKMTESYYFVENDKSKFSYPTPYGKTFEEILSYFDSSVEDPYSDADYTSELVINDNKIESKLNRSISELSSLDPIVRCYDTINYNETDRYISIETISQNKCFSDFGNLESAKFVLKTNHKVSNYNGQKQFNGEYTWDLKKGKDNKIKFTIQKEVAKKDYKDIILISLCLILLIGYKIYLNKKEK